MRLINTITQDSKQKFTLISETGENINFYLYYMPTQQQWVFDVSQGEVNVKGIALTRGPNLLRNYRKLIDFGLMCNTTDGFDPYYLDDFVSPEPKGSPRVSLFLLNAVDVENVENSCFR